MDRRTLQYLWRRLAFAVHRPRVSLRKCSLNPARLPCLVSSSPSSDPLHRGTNELPPTLAPTQPATPESPSPSQGTPLDPGVPIALCRPSPTVVPVLDHGHHLIHHAYPRQVQAAACCTRGESCARPVRLRPARDCERRPVPPGRQEALAVSRISGRHHVLRYRRLTATLQVLCRCHRAAQHL